MTMFLTRMIECFGALWRFFAPQLRSYCSFNKIKRQHVETFYYGDDVKRSRLLLLKIDFDAEVVDSDRRFTLLNSFYDEFV